MEPSLALSRRKQGFDSPWARQCFADSRPSRTVDRAVLDTRVASVREHLLELAAQRLDIERFDDEGFRALGLRRGAAAP